MSPADVAPTFASAEDLRREFDAAFARPPASGIEDEERLLAVRVGGDRYAIRLAEIAALHADRTIVPLPSPLPELLGLAAFRGDLAPVYDLAALLGHARRAEPRWLVLSRSTPPVGLAFDVFDAQLVVRTARIFPIERDASPALPTGAACMKFALRADDGVRPILELATVVDELRRRAATVRPAAASA